MPIFDHTGPPGSLKPSTSHGCFDFGEVLIQFFAASIRPAGGTMLSTSFMVLARSSRIWSPLSRNCSASAVAIMRGMRCVPPAPGKSPTLISGRPSRVFGLSAATRWWQESASSKQPPIAVPLSAATHGFPSVSSLR